MQGVAMKADEPGATLGIALEDYNKTGIGRILAYVKTDSGNMEMYYRLKETEKELAELRREIELIKGERTK